MQKTFCGSASILSSHRDMASLLTSRNISDVHCRSLTRSLPRSLDNAAPSPISRPLPIVRLDKPERNQFGGRGIGESSMEQHLGLQGAHLTIKNTTLARLQLVLTDDALKGELRPEACSSLLLECAVSCQSSTWPLLWRHYKTAVSLLGGVSEAASEALWRAAIKASYVAHAVEIFKDSIARQDSSSLKGLVAHQRKYSAVISQLLKVKSRGLANKQLAYGLWREIYASARESKRYAIDLGGLDAVTCRAGLNAFIECGKIKEARDLLSEMREAQVHPGHGSYNILIKFYCHRGDMEGAVKALHEMQSVGLSPDLFTYNTLICGYSKKGDVDKAKVVLDRAVEEGFPPDVHTYSSYLNALAKKGDYENARSIVETMWQSSSPSARPNAWSYSALIESYLTGGDTRGAEAAFEEMKSRDLSYSSAVGNLLIKNHLKEGSYGLVKAFRVLSAMVSDGVEIGADSYCLLMNHHAISGEEGSVQEVLKLLGKMRDQRIAPDAVQLSTLAKALVRLGRSSEALNVASEIDLCDNTGGPDLMAMNQAVYLFCQGGNMIKAEAAAARAASYALSCGLPPPVEAYGALIKGYYKRKELKPLVAAFRKFLYLGGIPHRSMANAVVRLCLLKGDNTTALQAIRAMKLLGVDMDPERYRSWVMQVQKRAEEWKKRVNASELKNAQEGEPDYMTTSSEEGFSSSDSENSSRTFFNDRIIQESQVGLERLKWFLGLPNSYYRMDFRD